MRLPMAWPDAVADRTVLEYLCLRPAASGPGPANLDWYSSEMILAGSDDVHWSADLPAF